jgi:RHS repeat-associated protein
VGSLRVVADGFGNVEKRIDYDSFGNIINDKNPSFETPFGFAGGLHDRETGLVRFGYRDYDPDVGRWTAKDPIGFWGGNIDFYVYALNNPINLVDPDGRGVFIATAIIGGVSGAIAGAVSGLQHGSIGAAIAGGIIGGVAGAFVGTYNPFGSSAIGTLAGSMAAGLVGGFVGGGAGAKLGGACPGEVYESARSGAVIGAISGAAAAPIAYLGGPGVAGTGYAPWVGEAAVGAAAESVGLGINLIGSSM